MLRQSKLLIVTPSAALRGGVERIVESLAAGLPAHGIDVVVGLAHGQLHDTARYREEYPQLVTATFESKTAARSGRVKAVEKLIRDVQPTTVLNARIYDCYEAASRVKSSGEDYRLITTIQAMEGDYFLDLRNWSGFVDGCVTSGELLRRGVENFTALPAERTASIAGGVRPATTIRRPRSADAPLSIGYVGRFDEHQKRIGDLVKLGDKLHDSGITFKLVIAGSGPGEQWLREEIATRGWSTAVDLRGWCSSEELYGEIYPSLDVLVHFAAFEGITIAPREAMAHGAVPVISRFPGLRSDAIFRDGENALTFEVGDVDEAANHVARLAREPELLEQLSRNAVRSYSADSSDGGAVRAWAEFIHKIEQMPLRRAEALPSLPSPRRGRLDDFLPPAIAEKIRQLRGARSIPVNAGDEWPHHGHGKSRDEVVEIERRIIALEEQ